jgi:flagellar hook-length control protein FliK
MAAIVNSGGPAAANSSPIAVTGTGAPSGAAQSDPAATATDVFEQLIAEMLGASSAQAGAPSSQDLATLDLTGDQLEMPTDERDSDTDESDDEEASALAALLGGFPGLAYQAPLGATSGSAASGAALTASSIEDALLAKSADITASDAAINELAPDSADARAAQDGDLSSTAATGPSGAAGASSGANAPNTSAHIHAMAAAHAASDVDVMPDTTLRAPVGSHAWKDELGTQLTWMALNNRDAASLRLSPEHLGPLEVRISMREGEASVYFGASNPDTRSALEQSLPRLRELFASQGLVLADAGVSRDAPRNAFKPSTQPGTPRSVSDASSEAAVRSVTLARVGLIDTYV